MSISSLLDSSRRALSVHSQYIRAIGDNIANVNTPGYSRRKSILVAEREAGTNKLAFGSGVNILYTIRQVDEFINKEYQERISARASSGIQDSFLNRAEEPFQLDGQPGRIGYAMTEFFSSLQDLASNPSDIALRAQVIQSGQSLASSVRDAYSQISDLQREADDRVEFLVDQVNSITTSIAQINGQINKAEVSDQQALSLRDERDQLLRDLSQYITFSTVEDNQGMINVSLQNGFALVNSTTVRQLEFDKSPSFAPTGGYAPGLDGAPLGHIVYSYSPTEQINLSSTVALGDGEIAGLLAVRGLPSDTVGASTFDADGSLVDIASRIECIARDLLTRFNLEYLGPDENTGTAFLNPSSRDLDGNAPAVYGLFSFDGISNLTNNGDLDNDGRPDDISSIVSTTSINSFASILSFAVADERKIATARDLDATAGAVTTVAGDASNIEALLTQRDTLNSYNLGSFSSSSKIDDIYNGLVSHVGALRVGAENSHKINLSREAQVKELQADVSGVSLDEELASLVNAQRAFQASSKLVGVGNQLLEEILNALG